MKRRIRKRIFKPDDDPQLWREALEEANIPARYAAATMEKVPTFAQKWVTYHIESCDWLEKSMGYVISGRHGVGKSSIAGLFAKDAVMRCETVLWLAAREVPGVMFREGDRNQRLNDRLYRADVLIVDDLGAEGFSAERAGGSALEGAIRVVYDRCRSIIITTNLASGRLQDHYPEPLTSVVGRITEWKEIVE